MALPATKRMTYAEYLALEEASVEKHAFADGELFAMSGGTPRHAVVQLAIGARLLLALAGRRCRAYGPDLRIYLPHLGESCYADATVVCGPLESHPDDPHAAINPTVLCEVLSPSTEDYDRGRKFKKYRGLASFQEYVLLAQDAPSVELHRRDADGTWRLRELGPGDTIELASIGVRIAVDDVYRGVFEGDDAG